MTGHCTSPLELPAIPGLATRKHSPLTSPAAASHASSRDNPRDIKTYPSRKSACQASPIAPGRASAYTLHACNEGQGRCEKM